MNEQATSRSVIAAEVQITGQIKTSGGLEFNGKLDGQMDAGGDVILGKGSVIKGDLTINSISVAGTVNGNITARDRIELKSSAQVMGDIKAKRLAVEDGVTFVGKSEVNPSGSSPAQAPAPQAPAKEGEGKSEKENKGGVFGGKK